MKNKKDYRISHTATRHQESYAIYFDNKEFLVYVKDCQKHHKDYPEMTDFEIIQKIHPLDKQKICEIISEVLKDAKTSNSKGSPSENSFNKD
jgi:hypothetical protein